MGGMLHPTCEGIIIGRIVDLKNSDSIVDYILKNDLKGIETPKYYTPVTEYYIGFGTGYELGQKLRESLKNDTSSQITLNKKIEYFSSLLEKQYICKEDLTQSYIGNIRYWAESNVPFSIINDMQTLWLFSTIELVDIFGLVIKKSM